jgi:hypothetical protein
MSIPTSPFEAISEDEDDSPAAPRSCSDRVASADRPPDAQVEAPLVFGEVSGDDLGDRRGLLRFGHRQARQLVDAVHGLEGERRPAELPRPARAGGVVEDDETGPGPEVLAQEVGGRESGLPGPDHDHLDLAHLAELTGIDPFADDLETDEPSMLRFASAPRRRPSMLHGLISQQRILMPREAYEKTKYPIPAYRSTAQMLSPDPQAEGKLSSLAFSFTFPRLNMVHLGAQVCQIQFCLVDTQSALSKSSVPGSLPSLGEAGPKSPCSICSPLGLRRIFSSSASLCSGMPAVTARCVSVEPARFERASRINVQRRMRNSTGCRVRTAVQATGRPRQIYP